MVVSERRKKIERKWNDEWTRYPLEDIFRHGRSHSFAYKFCIMIHPDDDGQPTSVPEKTRELDVGEKIENGDLKWHQSANEWVEIQTLGYRIVKASQKGLFRRYSM